MQTAINTFATANLRPLQQQQQTIAMPMKSLNSQNNFIAATKQQQPQQITTTTNTNDLKPIQMRTIFSCMWPSCTRNCDSLEDIERHVRSHLGHKQSDSIGDEDFYYEETEVDEATYLAIFDHHDHHAISLANGRSSSSSSSTASSDELGQQKRPNGPGNGAGGQLSPSHNSDGLSSGRSFTSSSPASSPVCSTDSAQSSPSASVMAGAMALHHHNTSSGSISSNQNHHQQPIIFSRTGLKAAALSLEPSKKNGRPSNESNNMHNNFHPLAGVNQQQQHCPAGTLLLDNPFELHPARSSHRIAAAAAAAAAASSTSSNYWFTTGNFQATINPNNTNTKINHRRQHHDYYHTPKMDQDSSQYFLDEPGLGVDNYHHYDHYDHHYYDGDGDDDHEAMKFVVASSGRGLATSAYKTGINYSAGRPMQSQGQRKRPRNGQWPPKSAGLQNPTDEQPDLQFSLELGGCTSPEPGQQQLQSSRSDTNIQSRRGRTRTTSGGGGGGADQQPAAGKGSRAARAADHSQQQQQNDVMSVTPVALADHTYNSAPPARPSVLSLDMPSSAAVAATFGKTADSKEQAPRPKPARARGRKKCHSALSANENELLSSHQQLQQQQQLLISHNHLRNQQPRGQFCDRPGGQSARRKNHLNHEIFQYHLPGKRGAQQRQAAGQGDMMMDQCTGLIDLPKSSSSSNSSTSSSDSKLGHKCNKNNGPQNKADSNNSSCNPPGSGGRRSSSARNDSRKCRKVYGMDHREQWCTQCKWKKACSRFCDQSA